MFGDPLDLFGPNAHHATRLAALLLVCGVPLIGAAGTSAAADADEPTWQGVERIGHGPLVVMHDWIAVRRLVTGTRQGVQGQRIVVRRRDCFFDQGTENTHFDLVQ